MKLGVLQEQEVEIALARVRERLLEVHVARALELITQTRDQLPTWRGLAIYCQLHRLVASDAAPVRTRVLARLGQRVDARMGGAAGLADLAAAEEWDSPWSWVTRMRKRLQGRRNTALRRWIELHSGRTESELLSVHVGGALRLVELLKPESSYAGVVQLYTDRMGVPPSLSRAIYFLTLSRLSDPAENAAAPVLHERPSPRERRDDQPLRIVPG